MPREVKFYEKDGQFYSATSGRKLKYPISWYEDQPKKYIVTEYSSHIIEPYLNSKKLRNKCGDYVYVPPPEGIIEKPKAPRAPKSYPSAFRKASKKTKPLPPAKPIPIYEPDYEFENIEPSHPPKSKHELPPTKRALFEEPDIMLEPIKPGKKGKRLHDLPPVGTPYNKTVDLLPALKAKSTSKLISEADEERARLTERMLEERKRLPRYN